MTTTSTSNLMARSISSVSRGFASQRNCGGSGLANRSPNHHQISNQHLDDSGNVGYPPPLGVPAALGVGNDGEMQSSPSWWLPRGMSEKQYAAALAPCLMAISFMNCKNVAVSDNEPATRKKSELRAYRGPMVRYKTLEIEPISSPFEFRGWRQQIQKATYRRISSSGFAGRSLNVLRTPRTGIAGCRNGPCRTCGLHSGMWGIYA